MRTKKIMYNPPPPPPPSLSLLPLPSPSSPSPLPPLPSLLPPPAPQKSTGPSLTNYVVGFANNLWDPGTFIKERTLHPLLVFSRNICSCILMTLHLKNSFFCQIFHTRHLTLSNTLIFTSLFRSSGKRSGLLEMKHTLNISRWVLLLSFKWIWRYLEDTLKT